MIAANFATGEPNTEANLQPNTTTDHEVTIAADENDDTASQYAPSVSSSTNSITSSIYEYRIENGRTYHKYKDGKYMVPNDARELERRDHQHYMFMKTFDDRLGTAPPAQPGSEVGRVLDLGTGTGIWAMDFGDEHPEAEVLGVDLSATLPEFTPPNVKFEIDDVEESWTYSEPFDYIHSRMMNSSISDWRDYIKKCYDIIGSIESASEKVKLIHPAGSNLYPGGYLELSEIDIVLLSDDGTLKPDHYSWKIGRLLKEATEKAGRRYQEIQKLKPVLMELGFEDVTMPQFKWPVNSWPKEQKYKDLGEWNNENLMLGWEGICMAPLTRALGWTKEEVHIFMMHNRKEFNDKSIHQYFSIWNIYGRKPVKTDKGQ
ncbi:methyltransferase domain-containing protein [Colletotrichum chrysophilum]|uniref:Methyltransferase domain-containing protein n=1 Tax=Colletotrichum chrysophilum TaxID=1836956 RepID=A0AAD9EGW3_9PEZI|nr:methyltransferase domain-containing protein [Colletotrichum chrysophilum]